MVLRHLQHLIAACYLFLAAGVMADSLNLPELGDSTSSVVSRQQENLLGQYWLRAFRQQTQLADDPLLYTYLHHLIQQLALASPLDDKSFDLVVVDSKSFNAFAVPGNIIGINTGLFLHADTEDQLASVIAHELAHLSQRHYARSVEQQKRRSAATLAGLLASLLIMAAGGGDAGIAALTATQAAAIDNQLRYSRSHEQEADRIGIQTLAAAGLNPQAAADMFQHMLSATRYRSDLKDFAFLLTHPLADSRVADASNQARQYPQRQNRNSLQFQLMKARVYLYHNPRPDDAVTFFQQSASQTDAARYGLALALLKAGRADQAEPLITALLQQQPRQTAYQLAQIDLLEQQQKTDTAISLAEQQLALSPYNYAISMQLAGLYQRSNRPADAAQVLRQLAERNWPDTPDIWYLLAEVEGLAGHIAGVHTARAEYFLRVGAFDEAIRHLNLARPLLASDPQAASRLDLRLQQAINWKQNSPF
ncbi:MAG TPA: M48 family metalloprotease [Pseudomonadales bacterium]